MRIIDVLKKCSTKDCRTFIHGASLAKKCGLSRKRTLLALAVAEHWGYIKIEAKGDGLLIDWHAITGPDARRTK